MVYCLQLTASFSSPISNLFVDIVVHQSLHSRKYELTYKQCLTFHFALLLIYPNQINHIQIQHCQIDHLQIDHLQINHLRISHLDVYYQFFPFALSMDFC